MGLNLNEIVKPQTIELNKKATVFSSKVSPIKRLYVEGKQSKFKAGDKKYLLKNISKLYRIPLTLKTTLKLIKKDQAGSKSRINKDTFSELEQLMQLLKVDDYGFFKVLPEQLFAGCGIPHKHALVFSSAMNPLAFKTAPSIACKVEVANIYIQTGDIANEVAKFLQDKGFGASPNHSMGGQLDYSMAAEWAGIGIIGRHSMAITRKNGPCHRLSVVYTNIDNLDEYIKPNTSELEWIKDFCSKCGKCIRNCPTEAIYQFPLLQENSIPTRIHYEKCSKGFLDYGCGICIKECPFTTGNYEKIKEAFLNKNEGR